MSDKDTYNPRGKNREILARAYELVQSVPYDVSARWLFYRLLQEGYYNKKSDYNNKWIKAVSSARHAFYNDWHPDTLADETREVIARGTGFNDGGEWIEALAERITCNLDKWDTQEYYVELWYEARAMTDQFRHYTDHITLVPMGGQPSIPYKWDIAKRLERAHRTYGKPIKIVYFGDLDDAGQTIQDTAVADVQKWCSVPFDVIRGGLNPDDPQRYNVPENPDKPGEYQWEALTDEAAREIITNAVDEFLRHDAFSEIAEIENDATDWLRERLTTLAETWQDET